MDENYWIVGEDGTHHQNPTFPKIMEMNME